MGNRKPDHTLRDIILNRWGASKKDIALYLKTLRDNNEKNEFFELFSMAFEYLHFGAFKHIVEILNED